MHQSSGKAVQACGFCGGAQYELTRCIGCGAMPAISAAKAPTQIAAYNAKYNTSGKNHSSRKRKFVILTFSAAILLTVIAVTQKRLAMNEPQLAETPDAAVVMTENTHGWYLPDTTSKPYQHTETAIRQILDTTLPASHQLHYVGVNQSADPSGTVTLNLKPTNQVTVLVLSSYQPVSWVINNKHNNELAAIVYGSHHQGSSVSGDITSDTSLLPATTRIGELTVNRSCNCVTKGLFQCTGNDPMQTIDTMQNLSAGTLASISNEGSASIIDVPRRNIDSGFWQKYKQLQTDISFRESNCIS